MSPRPALTFLNRVVNPIVRTILRSPLHAFLSGRLMLLTYTRGNGEQRTIPVGYTREGDTILVAVGAPEHKRWWRAVRRHPDVAVVVRGARRSGRASVTAGDAVTVDVTLGGEIRNRCPRQSMTPLAQLVDALLESTAPVTQILDDVDLSFEPPDPDEMRMMLGSILAPLEQLYQPRDLLIATAVLEAVTPMILETTLLLDPRAAETA